MPGRKTISMENTDSIISVNRCDVGVADLNQFKEDVAKAISVDDDINYVAAKHGTTVENAVALITENEAAIDKLVATMKSDGRHIQLMAEKTLGNALRQLAGEVEAGNLNHGMLIRTVELLNKVSGLEAKQRAPQQERAHFSLVINFGKDDPRTMTLKGATIDGVAEEVDDAGN